MPIRSVHDPARQCDGALAANLALIDMSSDRAVCVTSSVDTDLLIDVTGFFGR